MEALALLTGVFWKIYDDYADNQEAYSFLKDYAFGLELVVIVFTLLVVFSDNMFLIYTLIVILSDCILYILKNNDETLKLNYAVDTDFWKVGAAFCYILILFRINTILTSFTVYDYGFMGLGTAFIFIEIVSQFTKKQEILTSEKENHLFLEASNQKFITRILELIVAGLFYYFVVLQFDYAHNFKNLLLFTMSYMSVSIGSILYLKYYYFSREGESMFAK